MTGLPDPWLHAQRCPAPPHVAQEKAFEEKEKEGLEVLTKKATEMVEAVDMHKKACFYQNQARDPQLTGDGPLSSECHC